MKMRPVPPLHLAVLFITLIALLAYSFTPLATVSATRPKELTNPCAQDPNNLTTNGSMIGPGYSNAYGTVTDYYNPFVLSANVPVFEWVSYNAKGDLPGSGSQHIYADLVTFDAGIYQKISNLVPGTYYRFWLGFALAAYDPGDTVNRRTNTIGRQVGVDPMGGTNPLAPTVQWGNVYWDGIAALDIPNLNRTFVAANNQATIFLRVVNQNTVGRSKVWFDSVCMERLDPQPSPTPPLTSPTPSTNYLPLVQVAPTEVGCVAPSVLTSIAVGAQPKGIAVDTGTNRAFVGLFGSSSIAVVDAATNQLAGTWGTGTSGHTNGVAFANQRVFAALRDTNSVAVLDATTGGVLTTKGVGSQPWGVGASNNRVWVANFSTNSVSTLDATTNNVIKTLGTGNYPSMVSPAGSHAFVALMGGGIVDVDSAGNQLQNWGWDAGAFGIAFNASANRVYVASRDTNKLAMLNASTGANVTNVTLANVPYALAYNATTNHLFVVFAEANQVNIRDGTSLADLATLTIGAIGTDGGDGIAVMNNRVYISNYAGGTVTVIRDACP